MINESAFHKCVKNKQVAFVGLAPNIRGAELGGEIDKFDIVIRSNIFPIPEDLVKDYGRKCNILALHIKKTEGNYNVKNIVTYKNVKKKRKDVNYILITKEDRLLIRDVVKDVVGKSPIYGTQGVNIMYFCLRNQVRRFKFFGVTGYQDEKGFVVNHSEKNHYVIHNPYYLKNPMINHPYHDFDVLNDYLKLLLRQGKIEMDKYSLKYFNNG